MVMFKASSGGLQGLVCFGKPPIMFDLFTERGHSNTGWNQILNYPNLFAFLPILSDMRC